MNKSPNFQVLGSHQSELSDFIRGFKLVPLWMHFADQAISSRFRGSHLGAWWLVVSQVAFAGVAGTIWATIFHLELAKFVPFIAVSFAVWAFLSGSLIEACASLTTASGYLRQMALPLSLFVFRSFLAHCFYLAIGLFVALGLMLAFGRVPSIGIAWMVPGLALSMFSIFWLGVLFAFAGARFRDLTHGVANLFQVLYVVTPVIYPPTLLTDRGLGLFVQLNPFAGFMEIIRHPLIEGTPADIPYYLMVASLGIVAMLFSLLVITRWGRRVVFWL